MAENWAGVFSGVPDFHAELLAAAPTGDGTEIAEWRWSGTFTDGAPFLMCGVTVMGIEAGRIAWGRLYMEAGRARRWRHRPDGARHVPSADVGLTARPVGARSVVGLSG